MDSRLNPLFRLLPRHAEGAGTRHEIKRHEKDDRRKSSDGHKEDSTDEDAWQDTTIVSIPALQQILEQLVMPTSTFSSVKDNSPVRPGISPASPAVANPAAVRAYQRADKTGGPAALSPPLSETRTVSPAPPSLTTDETRAIYDLLDDLAWLSRREVKSLAIARGESFLQSLIDAAKRQKLSLS